jgi:hypothetical protein
MEVSMKNFISLLVVVAWVATVPTLSSAAKPAKVLIAHLAEVVEDVDVNGDPICEYQYNVIEVSEKSLGGHVPHGDIQEGENLADGTIFEGYAKGDKIFVIVNCLE